MRIPWENPNETTDDSKPGGTVGLELKRMGDLSKQVRDAA